MNPRPWPPSPRPFFSCLQPLFLNEVLVKMPPDPSSDEPLFHVSHIDRVYTLKTETLNERSAAGGSAFPPGRKAPVSP